jgi:hypothetical protein
MAKMMKFIAAMVMCVAAMAGCTMKVNKDWSATGGSRSDATVKMSYQYDPMAETPIVADEQALLLAKQRCLSWGYSDAEAFGGTTSICQQTVSGMYGSTCRNQLVTKEFQCIGRGDSTTPDEKKVAPAKKK